MAEQDAGDPGQEALSAEERCAALEAKYETVRGIAEAAYHLTTVLDPRTLEMQAETQRVRSDVQADMQRLRSELESAVRTLDELRTYVADVQRMATIVWDQAAVSRRLARIEELLMNNGDGDADAVFSDDDD